MKKIILGMIAGIALTALIAAGIENYQVRKNTAEVPSHMGVYVFFNNTPVMEYDVLGDVKVNITNSQRYNDVTDAVVKKAKKQYPGVEAVMIYPGSGDMSAERGTAIKFK